MLPRDKAPTFVGPLASYCAGIYAEKRALGYRYLSHGKLLQELDRFSLECRCDQQQLPKEFVVAWIAKRPNERPGNQRFRIMVTRQLAMFMIRHGVDAYVPPTMQRTDRHSFTPYIFTREQAHQLLNAADRLLPYYTSPQRHYIMPVVFRILYGCGLRVSEVCNLQVRDVNLAEGILTIRGTKFDKDRLVPMSPSLTAYLRAYASQGVVATGQETYFFPAPDRGPFGRAAIYGTFRRLLRNCGISYGGPGHGPRLHDIRHTFAVHCLQRWVREGKDLTAALPVLATYLGHNSLYATQYYLRLTAELYPDITARVETRFGTIVPERKPL
jgi:integrase/recombinase XerD